MTDRIEIPSAGTEDLRPAVPLFKDLLAENKREVMQDLNVATAGTIQSFDAATQTARVQINFKRLVQGAVSRPLVDYPLLVDCLVVFMGGGAGNLTFPVTAGDTCLVIFCDRDIDIWATTGQIAQPNSQRLHDLSDAIAIVGLRPISSPIVTFNEDGTQLVHGDAKLFLQDATMAKLQLGEQNFVRVGEKIRLQVGTGNTLKVAMTALFLALTTWVDDNGDVPSPATLVLINAAKTLMDSVLE